MTKSKDCKILFNYLYKHLYKSAVEDSEENENGETVKEEPFYDIEDLIKYINTLSKLSKFYELSDNKFCFLAKISKNSQEGKIITFDGYFISARSEFRPNLIDKRTGEERISPKKLNEGDIEKTHFVIKIDKYKKLVHLILEYNYHGINVNHVISYFKEFNFKYLKVKGEKRRYLIKYAIVPKDDFFTELSKLEVAKVADVYFDKQLLGSGALDFSDRYIHVKSEIKLTIQSKTSENIKETAVDIFNKMNGKQSNIEKLRVYGKDFDNNDVLLDTSFMSKAEFINVDLNIDTGDVNTSQILTGLKKIASQL